jgi:transposase
MKHYTIKMFRTDYNTNEKCLRAIFLNRYGKDFECPKCHTKGKWYLIEDRKRFDCSCGYGVYPLAGTIFHKSETPLVDWFYAIYLFASSRNGVSAKELERQLGVTYKTAWRIARQIRSLFAQTDITLSGEVETDETYVGGKRRGKRGPGAEGKTIVFGVMQRKGQAKAMVVPNAKRATILPILTSAVAKNSTVFTDELHIYKAVASHGYNHETVKHKIYEYVRGKVHTNSIEGFWSQLKRSLDGTHHAVSPKYLQRYVDEFVWRYNHRGETLFPLLVGEVAKPIVLGVEK